LFEQEARRVGAFLEKEFLHPFDSCLHVGLALQRPRGVRYSLGADCFEQEARRIGAFFEKEFLLSS
jgi:hypothetical protein